jgi:hypothetical protein
VLYSNIDRDTAILTEVIRGLPQFLRKNACKLLRLDHNTFLRVLSNSSLSNHPTARRYVASEHLASVSNFDVMKPAVHTITFNVSVTWPNADCFCIAETDHLNLLREIITDYCEFYLLRVYIKQLTFRNKNEYI